MTYEQYLKEFVADVIKATGMTFEYDYTVKKDHNSASMSVTNADESYRDLFVEMRFEPNAKVEVFEQDFSAHREAAVRFAAMAYIAESLIGVTLRASDSNKNKPPLCELSMYFSNSISISANGVYECYERGWSNKNVVFTKTYSKPTKTQIAAFAKSTFLKAARDDAANDVENTIDRLKEYHEEYVRQNKRLRLIDEMLS